MASRSRHTRWNASSAFIVRPPVHLQYAEHGTGAVRNGMRRVVAAACPQHVGNSRTARYARVEILPGQRQSYVGGLDLGQRVRQPQMQFRPG
jgi:hypothetical protein